MFYKSKVFLILLKVYYISTQNCTLENGINGQCKNFDLCPRDRSFSEKDASCGTGKFPDVCCEVSPEDNIEFPFGRIARRECEKLMDNYTDWRRYDFAYRLKQAGWKEYLYIAALGYGPKENISWKCAGGLISDKHVITSASCLNISNQTVSYIRLGDVNLDLVDEFEGSQNFTVVKATPYPKYNPANVYHDLAILELDKKINRTEYVHPACLEWSPIRPNLFLSALGWGDTAKIGSTYLERAEMNYYNLDKCKEVYTNDTKRLPIGLEMTQFCAGGLNDAVDTCLNDTGSPLTRTNRHIRYEVFKGHVIVGITAIGHLCEGKGNPGVYTNVYPYLPWVESIVWPEDDEEMEKEKVYWD